MVLIPGVVCGSSVHSALRFWRSAGGMLFSLVLIALEDQHREFQVPFGLAFGS